MATKKKEMAEEIIESEALTTTVSGDVDTSFEDWGEAIEGMEMSLSQIPTLKLMQALSPEVTSGDNENIHPGIFINDVTGEIIGNSAKFRLIGMWRQRVKFPPRDAGNSNIECSCPTASEFAKGDIGTTYGPCATCNFMNFDSKDHCAPQYTLVVALNDNPNDLYRIILSRTSYKSGKEFAGKLHTQSQKFKKLNLPMFMFESLVTAKKVKNAKINATYYVIDLDVPPIAEAPTMDEAIKAEFIETFKEVMNLRKRQIETARKIALDNMKEEADSATNDFKDVSSNIAEDMGLDVETEAATDTAEAKLPF